MVSVTEGVTVGESSPKTNAGKKNKKITAYLNVKFLSFKKNPPQA
jgi:hypothetical protein